MIVNITYPIFKALAVINGSLQYAAGYKVWAFEADAVPGLGTAIDTYSDPDCATPNTWPVVLDSYGEAPIYVSEDVKLLLSTPTGDWSSPIWSVDHLARQQNTIIVSGEATAPTVDNNYVCDVTPPFTALIENLTLVMKPDMDNVETIGTTTFTGTGISDLIFSGPYTGTTSGSEFSVQIDGTQFMGVGLNDVTWAGTPTLGCVYTVKISTAAATDKFQWRKNGGSWSAEIAVTGAAQSLVDGVTITFAATTGHTQDDLWNNVDTIKWRKDAGSWTEGVAITALAQTTIEGVAFTFSQPLAHTLDDLWVLEVVTPARLNLCSLGNELIYKILGGQAVALDGADMKDGIPGVYAYTSDLPGWILLNPSLPVLEALKPFRERNELIGAYTITENDAGKELSCNGTFTVDLLACNEFFNKFLYIRNSGSGTVTIDADTYDIKGPGGYSDTTYPLSPGDCIQLSTNGVNWHILTTSQGVPIGVPLLYGGTTAPNGFLLCNGAAVSRTTYANLFAVISTAFGVGDGSTTFNVPDLRQRFPIGKAASGTGSTLGGTGGNIDHTHGIAAHTHILSAAPGHVTADGIPTAGGNGYNPGQSTIAASFGDQVTGVGNSPFQAVNYIIKY